MGVRGRVVVVCRGSVAVRVRRVVVVVVTEPGTAADSAGPAESSSSRPELGLLGL